MKRTPLFCAVVFFVLLGKLPAEVEVFPLAGSAGVPRDVQPRINFDGEPALGPQGKIEISDAATGLVVDTIDVANPVVTQSIGGLGGFRTYPVTCFGHGATIHPRPGALLAGRKYRVEVGPGVFRTASVAPWSFTTRSGGPSSSATVLSIAADGSGDFCTVQGALDFIPEGNATPRILRLKPGRYTELVFFANKHGITLVGDDRDTCVIEYANNERFNPAGGNPYASGSNPSSASLLAGHRVYHRGVFLAHRVRDLTLKNLTIRNTTPHGGSQAEALILNGEPDARARLENLHLISYQDTVQINGQAYIHRSLIEGDVDFMWGTGPTLWVDCVCRAVNSHGYYTQIRNPPDHHGFVYDHCVLDGLPGVTGCLLSRIEPTRFPGSEVVLIDCELGAAVSPVAWQLQRSSNPEQVRYLEAGSHGPDGKPVDFSQRLAMSRRLDPGKDSDLIANYAKPAYVLGHGWNP